MSATVAEDLLVEIRARDDYVKSQVALGINEESLRDAQCNSLIADIACTASVTFAVATAVGTGLQGMGWTPEHKVRIANALGNTVTRTAHSRVGGAKRGPQCCNTFQDYMPQITWDQFLDPNLTRKPKTNIIGRWIYLCGMPSPDQKLLKLASSIIEVVDGLQDSPPVEQRDRCIAIKTVC